MKKFTFEIEISEAAFELLKKLKEGGLVEYRDNHYKSVDEFLEGSEYKDGNMTLKGFMARNADGTLHLIDELSKHNLVQDVEDAWHVSYEISELGLEVLSKNKNQDDNDYIYCPNCGRVKNDK